MAVNPSPIGVYQITGMIYGAAKPVAHSSIQLYAMSTQTEGAASTAVEAPVVSANDGSFMLNVPDCSSPTTQMYAVARGGTTGANLERSNVALAEIALLGPCSSLRGNVVIDEVTTLTTSYALIPFMHSYRELGASPDSAAQLNAAVLIARGLSDLLRKTAFERTIQQGALSNEQTDGIAKISTLSNVLAGCTGDQSDDAAATFGCSRLLAVTNGGDPMTVLDTISAAQVIARNADRSMPELFVLSLETVPFQPALKEAPADWSVPLLSSVGAAASPIAGKVDPSSATVPLSEKAQLVSGVSTAVSGAHPGSMTYYLSPNGKDSNSGLSQSTPWLTPRHSLTCGDVILASPSGNYSYVNFAPGQWGQVSCPLSKKVVWLKCAVFDSCKIVTPLGVQTFGMSVSASYWGVQGWEISVLGRVKNGLSCFNAGPADNNASIHHIVFANNVANVCDLAGFGAGNVYDGTASVDYIAVVGNIAYGAGTSNTGCGSGIGIYQPVAIDNKKGTHLYIAGNLSYGSTNPANANCYDGNGIIFDTFDGHANLPFSYAQQAVIENNIAVSNDGVGVRVEYNNSGKGPEHAQIIVRHNTIWGNSQGVYQYGSPDCGELQFFDTVTTRGEYNLAVTNQPGCYGDPANPNPAYNVKNVNATNHLTKNWGFSATKTYTQATNSPTFKFAADNVFLNPLLTKPAVPKAPHCSTYADVPSCMAPVVAAFKPLKIAATPYGFQSPSRTPIVDDLFPAWLCDVDLPPGLVSMGCVK